MDSLSHPPNTSSPFIQRSTAFSWVKKSCRARVRLSVPDCKPAALQPSLQPGAHRHRDFVAVGVVLTSRQAAGAQLTHAALPVQSMHGPAHQGPGRINRAGPVTQQRTGNLPAPGGALGGAHRLDDLDDPGHVGQQQLFLGLGKLPGNMVADEQGFRRRSAPPGYNSRSRTRPGRRRGGGVRLRPQTAGSGDRPGKRR